MECEEEDPGGTGEAELEGDAEREPTTRRRFRKEEKREDCGGSRLPEGREREVK